MRRPAQDAEGKFAKLESFRLALYEKAGSHDTV